jgi:hypothetical protein
MRSFGDISGKIVGIIEDVLVWMRLHAVISKKPISTNRNEGFINFIFSFLAFKKTWEKPIAV